MTLNVCIHRTVNLSIVDTEICLICRHTSWNNWSTIKWLRNDWEVFRDYCTCSAFQIESLTAGPSSIIKSSRSGPTTANVDSSGSKPDAYSGAWSIIEQAKISSDFARERDVLLGKMGRNRYFFKRNWKESTIDSSLAVDVNQIIHWTADGKLAPDHW